MQASANNNPFDRAVERVLRVERTVDESGDSLQATRNAENKFMVSMFFTGVRCILEYVALPVMLPLLGLTGKFGAPIVLVFNLVAMFFLVSSVRKFYAIDYRNKRAYLFVSLVGAVIMSFFIVQSIVTLLA
jgi:hypothetical protein